MLKIDELALNKAKFENEESHFERLTKDGVNVRIGASDLACPRKTYYSKTDPGFKESLKNFYRMRKGNYIEAMFEDFLEFHKIIFERQGSYSGHGIFSFIEIHPDLLIEVEPNKHHPATEELRKQGYKWILIELKSTNAIPKEPHDYWESQVNMQIDAIAENVGCDVSEIHASVFAIELNDGMTMQYPITYNEDLLLEVKEQALFLNEVLQDYVDFKNKVKDTLEFTAKDVPANFGNLCSICHWTEECFGKGKIAKLPEDLTRMAKSVREYKNQEKNIKGMVSSIKEFMEGAKALKAENGSVTVSLRGGKEKTVLDTSAISPADAKLVWKNDMTVFDINSKKLEASLPDFHKDLIKKYPSTKKSPVSVIIKA